MCLSSEVSVFLPRQDPQQHLSNHILTVYVVGRSELYIGVCCKKSHCIINAISCMHICMCILLFGRLSHIFYILHVSRTLRTSVLMVLV